MSTRKTLDDLPHFTVASIKQGEPQQDGSTEFELSGKFDCRDDVSDGSGWLLVSDENGFYAFPGQFSLIQDDENAAVCLVSEKSQPNVVGANLPYLAGRWEPHHVWMVVVPQWKWDRILFKAIDAISRKIQVPDVSMVEDQEVREWIEVKKVGADSHLSRYYPVFPDGRTPLPSAGPDGIIKGGWDHEHCELCNAHIEADTYGYLDLGEHWVCVGCYASFVMNHDLSFMNS